VATSSHALALTSRRRPHAHSLSPATGRPSAAVANSTGTHAGASIHLAPPRRPASPAAGTCRTSVAGGLRTYSSVRRTALRVTAADNQSSLSRIPIRSRLHKTVADQLCLQVVVISST